MALLDKVSKGVGVLVGVSGSKALVRHVEEGEVSSRLDRIADDPPLLGGGVDTSGVVGTGVEKEDRARWGVLDIAEKSINVKSDGLLIVVAVALDGQSTVAENGSVVGPRRRRQVDGLGVGVELLEKSSSDAESTGTRDRLGDGDVVENRGSGTVRKGGSRLGEGGNTGDTSVLMVEVLLEEALLGGAHGGENIRLSAVVTVRANTYRAGQNPSTDWRLELQTGIPRLILFTSVSALKASLIPTDNQSNSSTAMRESPLTKNGLKNRKGDISATSVSHRAQTCVEGGILTS